MVLGPFIKLNDPQELSGSPGFGEKLVRRDSDHEKGGTS